MKIKRFIECTVPVTVCNLKCSYCYIIQEGRRKNELPIFQYSAGHIAKALTQERLGGVCYINICGAGETLVPAEMPEIIEKLLENGHYINITTNGTLDNSFDKIAKIPKELLKRLNFAFSFHYLELLRINKLDNFFRNVIKMRSLGCSYVVQLNLCDEYLPYLDKIKKICMEKIGAYPQVAATRDEGKDGISLLTDLSTEEYIEIGKSFESSLFNYTMENFMKPRKEFCYAGDWSFLLDLSTGEMRKCYHSPVEQNIFANIDKPIRFMAVGNNCHSAYCINSSHFMSLGIIPELYTYSYEQLRNRKQAKWYSESMNQFLNSKLFEQNKPYNIIKKIQCNFIYKANGAKRRLKRIIHKKEI